MTEKRVRVAPNIYRKGKVLYFRQGGKNRSLKTNDLTVARAIVKEIKAQQVLESVGLSAPKTLGFRLISELLSFYKESSCPKRDESPRHGRQLDEELRRIENLNGILGHCLVNDFDVSDCREYATKRLRSYPPGQGQRSIDLELATLSCAFRWAAKHPKTSGINTNPIEHYRPKLRRSSSVTHCRQYQPENAEELHAIARWLFSRQSSQVFGWQCLFSAMIGQRCSEMLKMRIDGNSPTDPGYTHEKTLFLYRSETHKGTASFVQIHPALAETMEAHRQWLSERFPDSPWWFPSPKDQNKVVDRNSLGHAMTSATKALNLPHRTPHGLRSYFVNVLRSQGMADWQIALQIGHKSAGRLIVDVYGEILPIKIGWMPEGDPAWVD